MLVRRMKKGVVGEGWPVTCSVPHSAPRYIEVAVHDTGPSGRSTTLKGGCGTGGGAAT